ncbi:uncharacterized protein EI90DRAFT_3116346 [Cantharellus anzutake]|uniref:uncharacterized protein n=1 Tax=Cantharellus anzutake TaxID=1750568 RepID=UPI001906B930|nr:uncharacterized protein EI90DRAFT_3116346 [Cantharellus anzutake]KAF8341202.1 hypothetical protein EI90DRAFT_3116346 [Cantharellus anzutake]
MSGPAPTGPTSHGHSLPCTGPPARFPQQPPLLVRSHERQVTDSHQLGDSLWESQYPMLPVRSIERQVTASQLLPACPLPARSQECQVPVSRQPGGSLKEPVSYSLPVRSQECQVTVGQPTGYTARHSSHSALPPMATQPPPLVSRTAQVGFPGTRSCNIGAPTLVAPSSNSIVRPQAHTQEDYSSNLGTVNSDYQYSTIPLKRVLDEFSSPQRFYYERAPMDMLREWQRLGPDNIEVQPFRKLTTGSSTSYRLIDECCKQLTLILRAMDHFTQTISGSNLIRATFKADPEQIVYSTLITSGWTELSTLHLLEDSLETSDFVLHFEHAKEVLALTQSRAASSRFVTTDPSLAPVRPRTPEVIAIPPAAEKLELPSLHPSSAPDGTVAACTSSTERRNSSTPQSRQMTVPAQHSFELAHPLVQLRPSVAGSLCAGHLTGSTCRKTESMSLAAQLVRPAADCSTSSMGTISPSRYASCLLSAMHLDGSTQLVVDPALPTIQMDRPSVPSQHSPEPSHIHELLRPDVSCLSSVTHLDGSMHRVAASLPPIVQSDQLAALWQGSLERARPLVQLRQVVAYAPSARRFASPICRKVKLASLANQLDRPAVSSLRPTSLFRHCPVADRPISVTESIGPSHCQVEPLSLSVQSNLPIDASCTSSAMNLASSTRYIAESSSPTIQTDRLSDLAQHPLGPRSSELACPISLTPSVAELTSQSGQLGSITGPSRCLPEPIHSDELHRLVMAWSLSAVHISSLTHHAAFKCPTVQLDHPATPSWHPRKLACSDEPSSSVSTSTAMYTVRLMCHMGEPIPLQIQLGSPTGPSQHPPERTRSDELLRSVTACWMGAVQPTSSSSHLAKSTLKPLANQSDQLAVPLQRPVESACPFEQHCSIVDHLSNTTYSFSSTPRKFESSTSLHPLSHSVVTCSSSTTSSFIGLTRRKVGSASLPVRSDSAAISSCHPLVLACLNKPDGPVPASSAMAMHVVRVRPHTARQMSPLIQSGPLVASASHPHDSERLHVLHQPETARSLSTTYAINMVCYIVRSMLPIALLDSPVLPSRCHLKSSCLRVPDHSVVVSLTSAAHSSSSTPLSGRTVTPMWHLPELARPIDPFRPVRAHSPRVMHCSHNPSCYIVELRLTGRPERLVTPLWNPPKWFPVDLLRQPPELTSSDESHRSDVTSPSSMTRYASLARHAVNLTLSLVQLHLCHAIEPAPSLAQSVPLVAILRCTPESPDPLTDDPSSLMQLVSLTLLSILLGLPAAYSRHPRGLGGWYDPYHPASAGSPRVTSYTGSTRQAIAYSVVIDVQTLNRVFRCEVIMSNPQLGGTQIMTLMWSRHITDAKGSHFPTTSPFDGWIRELLPLLVRSDSLANPPHHSYELDERYHSAMAGSSIAVVSINLMGQMIEPVSLPGVVHDSSMTHYVSMKCHASKSTLPLAQSFPPDTPLCHPPELECSRELQCSTMAHPLRTMHTVTAAYCAIELTSLLGQLNLSTVISRRPLELARLLESYSSAVVHPLTLAYRQMNLLADPLRCPTESAYLRETDYSGVGESNKDHLAVLTSCVLEPGCSRHLCHSALTSRPIVTNHIRLSCQAVKPTPLSTLVGLLTVSMHSLLEAAHWQWSHHSVSAHTLIKTRPASTLHCADESTSSYNWLDLRAVPTCQLPEPAYLHGLCCSPVAHLSISARFTRMTRQASEPEFTHVHSGPLADAGYHLLEPALSYGSHMVCTSLETHPIRSAQRTVKPPLHDQSDPPVVPVHCPLDLACTVIHHVVEPSSPFGLSDFSAIPATYSLEQVPSRVWTQPELELSHMEPLRASLSMSCPKSLKRIYTVSLCLEMTGTMQAPPWHHPRETRYPPDVVHPTLWQSSSVVFIQVVWSATHRTRPRVDLGRALIPRWWSQVVPSLANYMPCGVVRIQGHDHPHGIYKHGNSSIMIQVASFPAGRLNVTPCYRKNPSSDRKTVAMTRPESSQWHLFQANCLCISVSSTTPRSTAASSDQSNPIVLPHPLRWSNHLIKRGNPLPSPVHSVFPVSYRVVGLSRLTSEPTQSFRVLAHSPSIQSRRSSVGEEELSPRDSMTGFSENQSLRQRTAPKGTCIKQVVGKVLSSYSLNTEDERFNLGLIRPASPSFPPSYF